MLWPDLITVRRIILPPLEYNERRLFGLDIMFSKLLQTQRFTSVVRGDPDTVRYALLEEDHIFR
jgi:hypothetical protein